MENSVLAGIRAPRWAWPSRIHQLPGRPLVHLPFLVSGCVWRPSATCRSGDLSQPNPDSPMEASPLLFLLESDVFQLQWTRDEADLAAFFHQTADPPVIVELLQILSGGHIVNMDKDQNASASNAFNLQTVVSW